MINQDKKVLCYIKYKDGSYIISWQYQSSFYKFKDEILNGNLYCRIHNIQKILPKFEVNKDYFYHNKFKNKDQDIEEYIDIRNYERYKRNLLQRN